MGNEMSELLDIELAAIETNPFRLLKTYPFNERKIETLCRSIKDVGLWEGVIARRKGNRFELAFGHHRREAARRSKLKTIPVIVRDLSDEQMLQFMGRENAEDFNADFLVMLETWEATTKFPDISGKHSQAIDIARFLGWTESRKGETDQLNATARACNAALALVNAGHLSRDDLSGLQTFAAREICERAQSRVEMIEKLGRQGKRPAKEIERDQKHVGAAARSVARDVREDTVSRKEIRHEIDYRAAKSASAKGRQTPLFAAFAKGVAENIHKMLVSDNAAERLSEMQRALPVVSMEEDFASLRRVDFALAEHEQVTGKWRQRLTPQGKKVVPFKLLSKGEAA
jgi:ParB-like chromosome segregation protein Spo0J